VSDVDTIREYISTGGGFSRNPSQSAALAALASLEADLDAVSHLCDALRDERDRAEARVRQLEAENDTLREINTGLYREVNRLASGDAEATT
jgi:chromosome segregation ATPase